MRKQVNLVYLCQGFIMAVVLAARGLRKKSLSKSGAMAAILVATLSWSSHPRFGITLLAFYQSGSLVTKFGAKRKMKLDANATEAGERNALQVLSCSLPATAISLFYSLYCDKENTNYSLVKADNCRNLTAAYVAFYACCTGDTFASELGILAKAQPVLITRPWRRVPPGTNGGITLFGTMASVFGGMFIGLVYALLGILFNTITDEKFSSFFILLFLGASAGLIGSILDSLLGATCQLTLYDHQNHCIALLPDNPRVEGALAPARKKEEGSKAICGRPWLSNHAVNALSSLVTAAIGPVLFRFILYMFFCSL